VANQGVWLFRGGKRVNRDCRRTPARACARRYCKSQSPPALFTHQPRHPPWAWSWPTTLLGMPHRIDGNACGSTQACRRCMPSPLHLSSCNPYPTLTRLDSKTNCARASYDAPRSISPCWPCGEGVARIPYLKLLEQHPFPETSIVACPTLLLQP
jgi:hypothetical protein